jgi:hypothetical protein
MVLTRVLNQTADYLLRTGSLPSAAAQQEEAERNLARRIKRLTYLMNEIPTRNHCYAQGPHAIDRRQPSLLPGVGYDYAWHLYETLLGVV